MPTFLGVLPDPYVPAPVLEHCPHCRGAVRPGAPWCTQCWADLRPAPEPDLPVAHPVAGPPVAAPVALAAGTNGARIGAPPTATTAVGVDTGRADGAPQWPCGTCGGGNPMELPVCAACGAAFLAAVRTDAAPLLVLPLVGDLARLGKAQRYALAMGVALVAMVVVVLLGLLFG